MRAPRKYLIVLFFMAVVGAGHAVSLPGLLLSGMAFAATMTDDGQPCPPECVTDSMEIVTWYPSPYNEYEELRLYPTQRDPGDCDDYKIGLMYYDHGGTPSFPDNDKMMICKGTLLGWQEVGGGAVKMAWGVGSCSADNKGEIAYNVTQKQVQFCDGIDWKYVADTIPSAPTLLSLEGNSTPAILLKWSIPVVGEPISYNNRPTIPGL